MLVPVPIPTRGRRGRGQHPYARAPIRADCSPKTAARPRNRRPAVRLVNASSIRLGSGNLRAKFGASVASERAARQLMVHAAGELGDVSEAQAPLRRFGELLRLEKPRRQPDGVERRPEPVLWMGVVGPALGRHRARRGPAEDDLKARPQHVGQHMAGSLTLCHPSNRLVVSPDLRILAQDPVDRLEHRPHARFRRRALDDHDQFRLVRRRAHEPPRAVLDRDSHAVDGD